MKKGYWIVSYQSVSDPVALASYGEVAVPVIVAAGGRVLVRGGVLKTYEAGVNERTVVIEFASVSEAIACYESDAYRKALAVLGDAAERNFRIVEGVG